MADGLNDARAMRIAEVLTQYRNFLNQIVASQVNVPASQAQAKGYVLLRQYHQQAQAMPASPLNTNVLNNVSNDNETKQQLQKILIDATARRFKAYKLVSKVTAVMRWMNERVQVLDGQQPTKHHAAALNQIDSVLEQELAAITNQRAYNELRARDVAAKNWMAEMATLQVLLSYIQAH